VTETLWDRREAARRAGRVVSASPRPQSRGWEAAWPLLLVVVCGAALRCYHLGSNSLWIDEFATLRISSLSLSGIVVENLRNSSFEPPLYFWLIHAVVQAFGSSETAMRLPSAIAGALTIPAFWYLIRAQTGNTGAALLGAALLAFNPLHLWYSQEARPYAFVILFVCLATIFLTAALRGGTRGAWIGFTACTLLAVFSHLVGLGLLAVSWILAITGPGLRRRLLPLVTSSVVVLAAVAPLLLGIARASADRQGNGSPARAPSGLEVPYTLFSYVAGYSLGPSPRDIQNRGPAGALAARPVESVIVSVTLVALLGLIAHGRPPSAAPFTLLFLLYVGMVFLASVTTGKAYNIRYTLPALLGFVGLLTLALSRLAPASRRAAAVLVLSLFAWADAQWFFSPRYRKDDSRHVVQWLAEHLPSGSVVLAAPAYVTGVLSHYAQRQGADLRFVTADAADSARPAAMLLTRLHHVPDPQSLEERFRRAAGPDVRADSLGGYLVFSSPREPAQVPAR
jgi:mannosyltransferase